MKLKAYRKRRDLYRILSRSVGYKINYIKNNLMKLLNVKRRGGLKKQRIPSEIFNLMFNDYAQNPQGEFNELKYELENKNGNPAYGGDLADLVYNSFRFKEFLLQEILSIGGEIGFKREQIIDCCILKYRSRWLYGKNYDMEKEILNAYLSGKPHPSEEQTKNAIYRIEDILSKKEEFKKQT